jgi:DNA repair photolyase
VKVEAVEVRNVLTRASGYLRDVCSHSLQPYRGCSFGRSLCGVACYVRHNPWVTNGRAWGGFLEVRTNAAESYRKHAPRERAWAREARGGFGIFLSSATDPFLPHDRRFGVTRGVLAAMRDEPPDVLIVQTHTDSVLDHRDALAAIAERCDLRVHLSIETDREAIPGLPPSAVPVARRIEAAAALRAAGLRVVATVAPLLPIADPDAFFARLAEACDAVVIDHFIGGDGSPDGARTRRTPLPEAMERLHPGSAALAYRDEIVAVARRHLEGRVGVGADGFAGRWLDARPS